MPISTPARQIRAAKKPVAVRQGVRLGEDYVPVLGELVVLDAGKIIERATASPGY
jgi:hypothetical protein